METKNCHSDPDPNAFPEYQRSIYASFRAPLFSNKPSEWEALARGKVPGPNFGYVSGSASSGQTCLANIAAFGQYRLRPHMLVNATLRETTTELFGTKLASPVLAALVGVQSIMHPDAEEATARACRELGIPMILSHSSYEDD